MLMRTALHCSSTYKLSVMACSIHPPPLAFSCWCALLPLQDEEISRNLKLALDRALAADDIDTCKTCWKYFGVISKYMRTNSKTPVSLPDACL